MKKIINSCIASFAMFSRIPMPNCDWEKDNIRFMLIFMPVVGAVIGGISYLWACFGTYLPLGDILYTVILFLIPFVLTGGIHLDGYLDTTDALSSWKPKEQRVEILKDVHVGAFAVIRGVVWFVFMLGVYSALAKQRVLWPVSWPCVCDEPLFKCTVYTYLSQGKGDGNRQYLAEGCRSEM